MKNKILFLITLIFSVFAAWAQEMVVVGNVPSRYLTGSAQGSNYGLAAVYIKSKIIQEVKTISNATDFANLKTYYAGKKILYASPKGVNAGFSKDYDFLFPGLIDLHNHTKQNNLGVWDLAKGQFENRFEWRDWNNYKLSVSANMNPWVQFGKPITCAAFRWSELQAMVLGTTYLQGPSSCISNFGIHRVEDRAAIKSKKSAVQAPTDLVIPADMTYVWDELRPLIQKGATYPEALAQKVNERCKLNNITKETVNEKEGLDQLTNQDLLKSNCDLNGAHPKFVRYVYYVHKTIASRYKYLKDPKAAAIIAHLAEGARFDKYNMTEFELVKLLGLDQPKVNFVHGVGITKNDLKIMGQKKMGLIWSLYSNLLLYGETLDIKTAKDYGITLALGSDWLPTGTRGVLDEVKLAAKYVDKDAAGEGLKKIFTDEFLFEMITENPAKLIGHYDIDEVNGEAGVGQIRKGAMGTLIVASKLDENPYTSLVRKTFGENLNGVIVDGSFVYGNKSFAEQVGFTSAQYELMPMDSSTINNVIGQNVPTLAVEGSEASESDDESSVKGGLEHLQKVAKVASTIKLSGPTLCEGMKEEKVFIHQNTLSKEVDLQNFQTNTGLNLDRYSDIYKLLSINMLTQSKNAIGMGNKSFAVKSFPPLFSCHDKSYLSRITNFVIPGSSDDEFTVNKKAKSSLRVQQKHGSGPAKLAEDYN